MSFACYVNLPVLRRYHLCPHNLKRGIPARMTNDDVERPSGIVPPLLADYLDYPLFVLSDYEVSHHPQSTHTLRNGERCRLAQIPGCCRILAQIRRLN